MSTKKERKEVYRKILGIAQVVAKQKKGAMFVICDKRKIKGKYELLYTRILSNHSINDPGIIKVLEKLSTLDGAIIMTPDGEFLDFGAKLKKSKTVTGFGTRHATASGITSSIKGSTAILVSEESNLIRVFRNGNMVLEMDAQEKSRSMEEKIASFLSDGDNALLTAAGASAAILGSAAILNPVVAPVIVVGGSVYLAVKATAKLMKKHRENK